jgi:outer membrane receptor for ferrienterochelin and colicins
MNTLRILPVYRSSKHHRGYFVNAAYETKITQKLHSTSKIYYRNTSIMPETGFEYTYQYQRVDFPLSNGQATIPTFDKAKQYYAPSSMTGVQQLFNYNPTETNRLVVGLQLDKFTRQSSSDEVGGVSLGRQQNKNSNIVSSSFPSGNPSVATVFYSTTASGYIQDEQKFFNDKLSFTLGVRHDQDSDYGKIWTKRAAIIGKPIEWYNVKFLYGEAFKAPTVFQLYDSFRGNLSLQPQKIRTYEVENSFFINKMATLKAGYFISLLDGQIAEGKNPDPNATAARSSIFQNYKPTHIYGFTFEGDIAITNEIKLFGNYTITRDRDVKTYLNVQANGLGSVTSISPVYDGREIDNIAERKGNLGINLLFFKKLNVNLRMNWVGRRKAPVTNRYFQPYDPNFLTKSYPYQTEGKPDGYMSGYTLLNATITYKDIWGIDGLELQVIGRNILNKAYMGMGRQSGNATRPVDSIQPSYVNSAGVGNPEGFVSPYHPQAGRELFLQVAYSF